MADNDELQQSLDTLGRHVRDLTRQMNRTGAQITSLNKTVGDLVAQNKNKKDVYTVDEVIPRSSDLRQLLDSFDTVLRKYADDRFRNKSGDINGTLLNKLHRRIEQVYNATSFTGRQQLEALNIGSSNPYKWSDTQQGYDSIRDSISAGLKDLKLPAIASKELYSMLGVGGKNVNRINLDDRVKVSYDEYGLPKEFINMDSDFAKLRDDVVALRRTLGETSKEVQTSNSHFTALSTNLQDLIDKSKTLNDIFEKINTSSTSLQNTSLPGLTTAVGDARTAMNSFVSGQNNALKSLNKSINNTIKTQQTVTNQIMQTAQKQSQQTQTGSSGNTFSRQVQKNDERARQAGFIAMLIPALAKLIEKTPFSDFIKVAGLMIGKFMPEIGALVASLAPLIGASILTKGGSSLVKMFTGRGAGKLAGGALKGAGAGLGMTNSLGGVWGSRASMGAKLRYSQRWLEGFNEAGINTFNPKYIQNYTPRGNAGNWGKMREGIITGRYNMDPSFTGDPRFAAKANIAGRTARRNLFRRMGVGVGRAGKFIGRGMPLWAAGTSVLEDLFSGQFTDAYKQGGWGGVGRQTVKTGAKAGVTAGGAVVGGLLGSALGPVGTAVGSMLGSIVANILYKSLAKPITEGFKAITAPFKSTFDSLKTHFGELFGGIGKAFKSIWGLFKALMNGLKIFKPIADWVTKWVGRILGGAFGLAITGVAKAIDKVITPFAKAASFVGQVLEKLQQSFHDFGQKLLTMPIIGKKLQEIYGPPETETVQKSVEGSVNPKIGSIQAQNEKLLKETKSDKYKVGTPYYNAYKNKLVAQYIRVNTPERRGLSFGNDETRRAGEIWAEKKIADEYANKLAQYRRNNIKVANMQNAVGTALPSNLKYETKNGITAVAMSSLGLRGRISSENSIPYIAANNAQNLKNLDAYLTSRGYKFDYTSAMGGSHAGGAKSHGAGQKVDLVLRGGGRLKKEDEEWLMRHGFYGGNTGAVGYHNAGSGFHYDLSVGQGAGLAASAKVAANVAVATATETAQQTSASLQASSEIREGLAKAIGEKKREDKTARARNIIFSAVDVTGSLGVWGITQINNTGRDAGRMRTGI